MPRGGKRPGAGRKAGVTAPTRVRRIPANLSDQKIDNLSQLGLLLDYWEVQCLNNPKNSNYYLLEQALREIRSLGY